MIVETKDMGKNMGKYGEGIKTKDMGSMCMAWVNGYGTIKMLRIFLMGLQWVEIYAWVYGFDMGKAVYFL